MVMFGCILERRVQWMAIMDGTRTVHAATAPAATPPSPTQLMHPAIAQHRSGISAICQGFGIRRLEARPTATQCIDCKTLAEIKEKQLGG